MLPQINLAGLDDGRHDSFWTILRIASRNRRAVIHGMNRFQAAPQGLRRTVEGQAVVRGFGWMEYFFSDHELTAETPTGHELAAAAGYRPYLLSARKKLGDQEAFGSQKTFPRYRRWSGVIPHCAAGCRGDLPLAQVESLLAGVICRK